MEKIRGCCQAVRFSQAAAFMLRLLKEIYFIWGMDLLKNIMTEQI